MRRALRAIAEAVVGGAVLGFVGLVLIALPVSIVAAVWWGVAASLGAK